MLRGPSAHAVRAGTTAGIVNMVSKRPLAETQREVGVQFGSWNRKQIQADLTGPLTRGRPVALPPDRGGAQGRHAGRLRARRPRADRALAHLAAERGDLADAAGALPEGQERLDLAVLPVGGHAPAQPERPPADQPLHRRARATATTPSARPSAGCSSTSSTTTGPSARTSATRSNENDNRYHYGDFVHDHRAAGAPTRSTSACSARFCDSSLTRNRIVDAGQPRRRPLRDRRAQAHAADRRRLPRYRENVVGRRSTYQRASTPTRRSTATGSIPERDSAAAHHAAPDRRLPAGPDEAGQLDLRWPACATTRAVTGAEGSDDAEEQRHHQALRRCCTPSPSAGRRT